MLKERNLQTLADFYEFTMANGYFELGLKDKWVTFDMFYRRNPDNGGFVIAAGLEQFVDYIMNLSFTEEDIEYFRSKKMFNEGFLDYLKTFKFSGNVYAVKEGTIVYPNTPIVTIEAPLCEAQIIETMLLLTINHQSLIATKANRIVRAAKGKTVMEFGARRAHGYDAAVYGTRAAYIAGAGSTATIKADQMFNIPAVGTMAHSWIQFFDNEYEAFKAYATVYSNSCTLLIDTYDVLHSGVPNAIKVAKEVLEPNGHKLLGVRIDSGDLAYLSKKVRKMLDDAGLKDTKIIASNSIDEYLLESLFDQGAKIDSFGIGERLITAKSEPVFGGVYKLSSVKHEDGTYDPKIKISENVEKITVPGFKKLYRVYDKNGMGIIDVMGTYDEIINHDTLLVDQKKPYKRYEIPSDATIMELQHTIIKNGELIYALPTVETIKNEVQENLNHVWEEEKRFINPHQHYVDLSEKLYQLQQDLLKK